MFAAQAALLRAQLRLWFAPRGALVKAQESPPPNVHPNSQGRLDEARALALAVNRAAAFGVFRPACLARSMALARLMESHGITGGEVKVGVIMRDRSFVAHAWVEYAGAVLGDDEGAIAQYTPLPGASVLHRR